MLIKYFYRDLDRLSKETNPKVLEDFLIDSLKEAKHDKQLDCVLIICNELGGFYRTMGRYAEAVPVYHEAIETIKKLGQFGSENHATTLINQATNYAFWGQHEDALDIFDTARRMLEDLGIVNDFRIASLHNNMSIAYQDIEDYEAAEEHLCKAMDILRELNAAEVEIAISYINLAQIQLNAKKPENALDSIKTSMELFAEVDALDDIHYCTAVETLGHIYDKMERYDEAIETFKEALDLVEKNFGTDHRGYQAIVFSIGNCERKQAKAQEKDTNQSDSGHITDTL